MGYFHTQCPWFKRKQNYSRLPWGRFLLLSSGHRQIQSRAPEKRSFVNNIAPSGGGEILWIMENVKNRINPFLGEAKRTAIKNRHSGVVSSCASVDLYYYCDTLFAHVYVCLCMCVYLCGPKTKEVSSFNGYRYKQKNKIITKIIILN